MKNISWASAAMLLTALSTSPSDASESSNYKCNMGGYFTYVTLIPEEGAGVLDTDHGQFPLTPSPDGFYRNDREKIIFSGDGSRGSLTQGQKMFPCQREIGGGQAQAAPMTSPGAVNGGGNLPGNVGRSLGGKLRAGPGTRYQQTGSLREGDWLTIIRNTGVRFDGYDWFEVALDNGQRGFQWGGIMCANGARFDGIFASCQDVPTLAGGGAQNSAGAGGAGFMAFATGGGGVFGHGAAPTRQQAEAAALQYCGRSDCRIEDVTQANCHALAVAPGQNWFGAGQNQQAAQSFAMGYCRNGGAQGCRIEYTYCQ